MPLYPQEPNTESTTVTDTTGTNTLSVSAAGAASVVGVPIGAQANAWNNIAVALNGISNVVDCQFSATVTVFGNVSGNVNPLRFQASQDNVNFYTVTTISATTGNFGTTLAWGARYMRLQAGQAATITATIAGK